MSQQGSFVGGFLFGAVVGAALGDSRSSGYLPQPIPEGQVR
jgi:hypothetical protein